MELETDGEELRDWLVQRIAQFCEREPADVDPDVPLAEYGVDSVYALMLCGELEDRLSIRLEPTVIWDHRTVNDLLGHLRRTVGAATGPS